MKAGLTGKQHEPAVLGRCGVPDGQIRVVGALCRLLSQQSLRRFARAHPLTEPCANREDSKFVLH